MKASFALPISALALAASAGHIPRHGHPVRTTGTLSSVASQISDALVALDAVVKPLTEDAAPPVLSEADKLIQVLRSSRQEIEDLTAPIAVSDIVALPDLLETLTTAGNTLMTDLKAKKPQVEAARICGATEIKMRTVSAAASRLVDAVVAKLPEAARALVTDATSGLAKTLQSGADAFGPANCRNKMVAPSAPAAPTGTGLSTFPAMAPPTTAGPEPTGSLSSFPVMPPPVTVARRSGENSTILHTLYYSSTVTEDCEEEEPTAVTTATIVDTTDCEEDVTPAPTLPPVTSATSTTEAASTKVTTSIVVDTTDCDTEIETPTVAPPPFALNSTLVVVPPTTVASETSQLITAPTEAPTPTVGTTFPVGSTSVYPTSTLPPIPTAGAVMNSAVGPVGIVAGLVAALLL